MKPTRATGLGVLGLLATLLAANLVLIVRHCDLLRPMAPGDIAPAVAIPRLDGTGTSDLLALRGQVVLLDFWATWCPPCRDSLPGIEGIYQRQHPRGLAVLSVSTDGSRQARRVRAFLSAAQPALTFPVYLDDGSAAQRYGVRGIPHLVLIDRRGIVRRVHVGAVDEGTLDDEVARLLDER